MSRLVMGVLKTAMVEVYQHEHRMIDEYIQSMGREGGCLQYLRESAGSLIEDEAVIDGKNPRDDLDLTICSGCS